MNEELLKLVTDTLNAVANSCAQDGQRIGSVLPALSGVGFNTGIIASGFAGTLEMHFHRQLANHQGPTATMLRRRARVGAGVIRAAGLSFYEATIDNDPAMAEKVIAQLAPFRAEQSIELDKVLSQLITPYLPSIYGSANAAPGEVHQGFNAFVPQPLQFDLDRTASPRGHVTCALDNQNRPAVARYQLDMYFEDAGGSRRGLNFHAGSTVYSLTNSVYDALEDATYKGDSRHYTVDQLREGLEAIFTAAGWSREVYEASQWTPERWTQGLTGIRYVGAEPEPLTLSYEARQLADMRYAGNAYCEWVDAAGDLRWNLNALGALFTGTLAADGSPSAPQIVQRGRHDIMEGPWAIRPHCLPDLLDTLLKHRTAYLERLREYRAGKRTLTGIVDQYD